MRGILPSGPILMPRTRRDPSGGVTAPNHYGKAPDSALTEATRGARIEPVTHLTPVPSDPPSNEGGSGRAHLGELLKRSSRGDEAAFAEWYDATAARAFGLALRVLRDRAQAEEVTQEVYLDCWRTSASFDETRGSSLSWLLTIVHRKAVDRVRSAEASGRRDTSYTQREQTVDHDSTAESATASLEASRVRAALD